MANIPHVPIVAVLRWSIVSVALASCGGGGGGGSAPAIQVSPVVAVDCTPAPPASAKWTQLSATSAWAARDSHVMFSARSKLYLYGGWEDSYEPSPRDLWESADGATWTKIAEDAASPSSDYAPVATAFGRQWMITGWKDGRLDSRGGGNEIWTSRDGERWIKIGVAPFSGRVGASLVAFKGKLWMFGGTEDYFAWSEAPLKNDVWSSSNGVTWTKVIDSAPWSPRAFANAAVLGDKLFLAGGGRYGVAANASNFAATSDVWSTVDGEQWVNETANAGWVPRIWASMVAYRGALWFMGGWSNFPERNHQDVWWSADGKQWARQDDAPWTARHALSTVRFNDQVLLSGGNHDFALQNDVWSLSAAGASKPECGPGY